MSDRQHAAIRLLLRGLAIHRVAEQIGVERHTITRWKHDPAFHAELNLGRQRVKEIALRDAAGLSTAPKPPAPAQRLRPPIIEPLIDPEIEKMMRDLGL